MPLNSLTLYRRHKPSCPGFDKGQSYSLCSCQIWYYGTLNGEQVRRSIGTTDAAQANLRKDALERGEVKPEPAAAVNLAEAVERFMGAYPGKPSTIEGMRNTLRRLQIAIAPETPVAAITSASIEFALRGEWGRNAHNTRCTVLRNLRAFFKWTTREKMTAADPMASVQRLKPKRLVTRPYTPAEIDRMFDAASKLSHVIPGKIQWVRDRAHALLSLFLYSGMRNSDVVSMNRRNLDLRTGHYVYVQVKTGAEVRIQLHPDCIAALSKLSALGSSPYFFWNGETKLRYACKVTWESISLLGKKAGIRAHPHRFRDTFAVELLSQGVDIRTVSKLLGHSSVAITEKYYGHFVAEHQRLMDSATSTLDFHSARGRGPVLVKTGNH